MKNNALSPTDFNRNDSDLEVFLLFAALVAGKNSKTQSKKLELLLSELGNPELPIDALSKLSYEEIRAILLRIKSGQYNRLGQCLYQLSRARLDLRLCSCEDLEKIHGIGMKTSRFFIVHSRENYHASILDTHILSWLRQVYPDAPRSTPTSKKQYLYWEQIFLEFCDREGKSPSEMDFSIWLDRQKAWN